MSHEVRYARLYAVLRQMRAAVEPDLPGSYIDPEELYRSLQRRRMDLVIVTDHDSIDAAGSLRQHPGFFLNEEVNLRMPCGGDTCLRL
jgi:hypothetical protein